ncbi:Double-stranded RNA-specific editase 1 [Smittium culicis]|uniref:Double-stranded RNA-specific editase 1 n=1 Tax=Smittium culicis TaxID=133412 RepID=A0A1R1XSH8_9FUNG|nr:Double-stranded RNA-specific editase 1 [Smittium culicis]
MINVIIRYLIDQAKICIDNTNEGESIFELNNALRKVAFNIDFEYLFTENYIAYYPLFQLKSVKFHMYTSQCPCGDSSTTILQTKANPNFNFNSPRKENMHTSIPKYIFSPGDFERPNKKTKIDSKTINLFNDVSETEIHSTMELARGRENYSETSLLRTKPGRLDSDHTLSMSCSDKIAMWNVTGIQSSLISNFIHPIYLDSLVSSHPCDLSELNRSLNLRVSNISGN